MEKHHNRKFITEFVELIDYRDINSAKELIVKPVPLIVFNKETQSNEVKYYEPEFKIRKEDPRDFSTFTADLIGKNKDNRTELEINESDLREYGIEKTWALIETLFSVAKEQSKIGKKPVSIVASISYFLERWHCSQSKTNRCNYVLAGFVPLRYNLHYINLVHNAGHIARKQNLCEVNSLIYIFGFLIMQGKLINHNYTPESINQFKNKQQEIFNKLFCNSTFNQEETFSYLIKEEEEIRYITDSLEWDNSLEEKVDKFIFGLFPKRKAVEFLSGGLSIKMKIIKMINEIFKNIEKMVSKNES